MDILGGLSLIWLAIVIFFIYIMFKSLQFIATATDLYKEMVKKQSTMVSLLIQIRDNTSHSDKHISAKEHTIAKKEEKP